jgi:hypothetical protein
MTNNGSNNIQYAGGFNIASIGHQHIRVWVNLSFVADIAVTASNGIQIQVISGSGTCYYTVGGSDTYGGGWKQFVIYTGNTPTSGSTPSGTVTTVGLQVNTIAKPRNVPANCYVDAWYYGDGFVVTGGTSGDEIDWSHIAAIDATNAYGICTRIDDVYFLAGDIKIGNGATATWFKSGQKIQFKDLPVSATLYNITFQGSGCTATISGGAWGAAGTQNYKVTASDTAPTVTISGVQLAKSGAVVFAAGQSITNCVFDNCGQVDPSTSTFNTNTFSNYVGTLGALLWRDSSNTKDLVFINCDNGVQFTTTSTPKSFDNIIFDDSAGNFDVNNTSGIAVVVNLTNGSNANSYNTGNNLVTFASSVLLSLTVKDEAGSPIQGAFAYIDDDDISPYIMNTTTNASGLASATWTGGVVVGARWRVRLYGYKPFKIIADIGTINQNIPVTLVVDPQQV